MSNLEILYDKYPILKTINDNKDLNDILYV